MANPVVATVADRLRHARSARFVGRVAELELFRQMLNNPEPGVLYLHGPGGVGKTALLRAFKDIAEVAGRSAVRVDAHTLEPSPGRFHAAVPEVGSGQVLLLDTYERLTSLDDWLRETYLPTLPADVAIVIAGRDPLAPAWLADPGWRDLLRVVSIRNLRPEDTVSYLRAEGVPERLHERIQTVTYGHPLALSLVTELLGRRTPSAVADDVGGSAAGRAESVATVAELSLTDSPDLVRVLLERFLSQVPDARHRHALEVCAHARFTTVDLLRHVLGDQDADQLFSWLRGLSFVEEDARGLLPHELVRDVVDADLRWRDPTGYVRLNRRVLDHVLSRVASSRTADVASVSVERQQALADLMFLHRNNPVMRTFLDFALFGQAYPEPVRLADRPVIVEMTRRHEGPVCANLVGFWMERRPEWMAVFRSADGQFIGFAIHLQLDQLTEKEFAADPGAAAMWHYAQQRGARPGEPVNAFRFFLDRDAYQDKSPSFTLLAMMSVQTIMVTPPLAMDMVGGLEEPDAVANVFASHGYERLEGEDFEVEGLWYGVFAHDFQRGERPGVEPGIPIRPDLLVLAQPEFDAAVRRALRDLHRPDALARSPLLRSRVVRDRSHGDPVAADLAALLRETVDAIGADPRDEKLRRAVDRTYVRAAATQEQAAEVLGLPFSTYRRHLTRGVERVVELLWHRELHGTTADDR